MLYGINMLLIGKKINFVRQQSKQQFYLPNILIVSKQENFCERIENVEINE